jgi:hypothetical protein
MAGEAQPVLVVSDGQGAGTGSARVLAWTIVSAAWLPHRARELDGLFALRTE